MLAFAKRVGLLSLLAALVVAGLVAALQGAVTGGKFEFGNVREFSGVLVESPVPMLIADEK